MDRAALLLEDEREARAALWLAQGLLRESEADGKGLEEARITVALARKAVREAVAAARNSIEAKNLIQYEKTPTKVMTKTAMAKAIAKEHGLQQGVAAKIISSLAEIGTKEVTSTGTFIFPGLFKVETRVKLATEACKKNIFGRTINVKAKPVRTIVKAKPTRRLWSALKKSV